MKSRKIQICDQIVYRRGELPTALIATGQSILPIALGRSVGFTIIAALDCVFRQPQGLNYRFCFHVVSLKIVGYPAYDRGFQSKRPKMESILRIKHSKRDKINYGIENNKRND